MSNMYTSVNENNNDRSLAGAQYVHLSSYSLPFMHISVSSSWFHQ